MENIKKYKAKGIYATKNGNFEARLFVQNNGKQRNSRNKLYSIYIGRYDTAEAATIAREEFIKNLF